MAQNPTQTSPVAEAAPSVDRGAPASPPQRQAWDDAPLRTKVTLLVAVAAVGGAAVGILEAHTGHRVYPLAIGLTVLVVALVVIGRAWVWLPMYRLLEQIEQMARAEHAQSGSTLPLSRRDEIGQIARQMHGLSDTARRTATESRILRKQIDHRVQAAAEQATRSLHRMAMRDPLTDLGNRRFLEETLEPLTRSCAVSDSDLLCVAIDVDNFKQVNDTLGHAVGDELLVFLGGLLRASIRKEDYAVRLGGDEFMILMPNGEVGRAGVMADQLRNLFRQYTRTTLADAPILPDLSIGVSSLQRDSAKSGAHLMELADQFLYEAKRAGKGRTAGATGKPSKAVETSAA